MDLLFRFDLQPVLDAPEETIGCLQVARFTTRDQFQLREDWERLQGTCFLQERVPRSMQELECLNDKFDFTNPACAQLDVPPDVFVTNDVPLDPSLDRGNFVEQIARRALRINEGLMLAEKFVGEFAAAANPSCLDEREPFPGFAETGIVILHALERAGERSGCPFRPEAEIDPKERPGRTQGGKGFYDFGSEQVEPFVITEIRRNLSFLAVKKDDVDVGTMIQFAAAQLSQSKNRELRLRPAAAAAQLCIPVLVNLPDTNFRQERQLEGCFFQRCDFGHLAQRYPEHFASLPKPKRAKVFRGNGIAFRWLQVSQHFAVGARRSTDFRRASQRRISGCRTNRAAQMLETEIKCRSDASPSGNCPIKSGRGGAFLGPASAHLLQGVRDLRRVKRSRRLGLDPSCGHLRRENAALNAHRRRSANEKNRAGRLARLRLFRDFFLGSGESSPFAPGKTLKTFAGNLIEDRIDFFGNKLLGSHRSIAFHLHAALSKRALQNGGSAETQKVSVKPSRHNSTEIGAVCDRSTAVERHAPKGDRESSIGEIFRFQADGQKQKNHRGQFQLGQDGRVGHQDSGHASRGRE